MSARAWLDAGTAMLLDRLDGLNDDELDAPSLLPGWSRKHVLAHVHFNALAIGRLVSWAATGVENPMYPSPQARDAQITEGAALEAGELRALVRSSAADLAAALDELTDQGWQAEVVTRQGRTIAATQLPWMRANEVMVHTVDLRAGVTFEDLPSDFTSALLVDVVKRRASGGEGAALAEWLTGRTAQAPTLGPWL